MKKLIAGFIGVFMLLMLTMSTVSALFSNSWTSATSMIDAPSARSGHTAVWDNVNWNDMYVWGGISGTAKVNTGAIYDTSANAWYPITEEEAPEARTAHTAVWANDCEPAVGDQPCMIIWGGQSTTPALNTGGRYDGMTGVWKTTSTVGAPGARIRHTAVWTGTEMIIWGGDSGGSTSSGGRYNPITDTWTTMSMAGVPQSRHSHTAVWANDCEPAVGDQPCMIIWGGINRPAIVGGLETALNTGAKYNPVTDTWTTIDAEFAPEARGFHTAVWLDGWGHMIVWGGVDCSVLAGGFCDDKSINTGGVYDAVTNTWWETSMTGAPSPRYGHTAVWASSWDTGNEEMLIWGGHNGSPTGGILDTGSAYNPATDTWTNIASTGAPAKRVAHRAVFTGTEMIIWGGADLAGGSLIRLGDGKRFTP